MAFLGIIVGNRSFIGLFRKRATVLVTATALRRETPFTYNEDKGSGRTAAMQLNMAPALLL